MIDGSYARSGLPLAVSTASHNAANQQTAFGSQSLTYDLNGNLASDGTNTYVWNTRDQLASMTGPGLTASFQYDAFGKRTSKTVNGATVTYLYDGANLVQEQSGGSPSANILAGAVDEIFTRTDAGGAWSPLFDGLGSTLALTDSTGTVQTQYTYDPFGKTTTSGNSNGNTSQYTGRENDGTGLYYYRGRYYSPSLQRFVSEDPIGIAGGINLYGYVGNDPISYSDPFGLKPQNTNGPDFDWWGAFWQEYWNRRNQSCYDSGGFDNGSGTCMPLPVVGCGLAAVPGAGANWPRTTAEMDEMLGIEGTRIPDGPTTPGRSKVVWRPSDKIKIVYEQHPYDLGSQAPHAGPHWHLDTPGSSHVRYLPGQRIP